MSERAIASNMHFRLLGQSFHRLQKHEIIEVTQSMASLNQTPWVGCGKLIDDRDPAIANRDERIDAEHPGGIMPTRHEQVPMNTKNT